MSQAAYRSFGPYDDGQQILAEPLPTKVTELHRSGRVRSGDPDGVRRDAVLNALLDACAGVEVGEYDMRTLEWLAGCQIETAQVVIGLITRAYAAGLAIALAKHADQVEQDTKK